MFDMLTQIAVDWEHPCSVEEVCYWVRPRSQWQWCGDCIPQLLSCSCRRRVPILCLRHICIHHSVFGSYWWALLIWYCHILLYFCFSITFSTLLIHHHAPHQCSLPHKPLWLLAFAPLDWLCLLDGQMIHNSHVIFLFLVTWHIPSRGSTNHKSSHCVIRHLL